MSSSPLLSIVVPVFNGARYLGDCLESLNHAASTVSPDDASRIEVIFADNRSTDTTPDMLSDTHLPCASQVVRPVQHEPNRTINWRWGFEHAVGEWIMMLHHDDVLAPGAIGPLLRRLDGPAAQLADAVSGRSCTFVDAAKPSSPRPRWRLQALVDGAALARDVLPAMNVLMPFTLVRRTAYLSAGGFDPQYELVQDWELWMRLCVKGEVLFVPERIAWWRLHSVSESYRTTSGAEHHRLFDALPDIVPGIPAGRVGEARRLFELRHNVSVASQLKGTVPEHSGAILDRFRAYTRSDRRTRASRLELRATESRVHARFMRERLRGTVRAVRAGTRGSDSSGSRRASSPRR